MQAVLTFMLTELPFAAAILTVVGAADPTWPEESADSVAVVLDVLPHAIGIERGGGIFDPLVPAYARALRCPVLT